MIYTHVGQVIDKQAKSITVDELKTARLQPHPSRPNHEHQCNFLHRERKEPKEEDPVPLSETVS